MFRAPDPAAGIPRAVLAVWPYTRRAATRMTTEGTMERLPDATTTIHHDHLRAWARGVGLPDTTAEQVDERAVLAATLYQARARVRALERLMAASLDAAHARPGHPLPAALPAALCREGEALRALGALLAPAGE
jgi:hypothetical protein